MDVQFQTVVLAALLHDIGKFLQRGDYGIGLKIEGKHPQISANFIGAKEDYFSKITDTALLKELVQRHHESRYFPEELRVDSAPEPIKPLAYIVSEADNLSSAERGRGAVSPQGFKRTPLFSVFSRITLGRAIPAPCSYLPAELSPEGIFSVKTQELDPKETGQYVQKFAQALEKVFSQTAPRDFNVAFNHWLALLEQFTWCIPSNTQDEFPDISLFDHLKTSSAIAASIYLYHYEKGDFSIKGIKNRDEEKFRLLVGDLTGIQRYIFGTSGINTGGVAKRIRARSFYLSMLTDVVSHRILHEFGLPQANIIMASGGKFYILLPNLPDTVARLGKIQGELDTFFLEQFNGELALNVAHKAFCGGDFEKFPKVLESINDLLRVRKSRPLLESLTERCEWKQEAFIRPEMTGEYGVCQSCGKMAAKDWIHSGEEARSFCKQCRLDLELGRKLANAEYLIFYKNGGLFNGETFPLYNGYSMAVEKILPRNLDHAYLIVRLNNCNLAELKNYPAQFRYLCNYIPLAGENQCAECQDRKGEVEGSFGCGEPEPGPGSPLYFDCIAQQAQGRKLLGYLKADVDLLGTIFTYGFGGSNNSGANSNNSISRTATLSRMLDMFFSGRVGWLLKKEFPNCYTVFSGGDDLLLIGPWDQTLELAITLRKEFFRYTGGNPSITISAGMVLAKPRHPLALAVSQAEDNLNTSKEEPGPDEIESRNQITFLEDTMKWDRAEEIVQAGEKLAQWILDKKVSVSFGRNLLTFGEMFLKYKRDKDTRGLQFLPMLNYAIARNLPPFEKADADQRELRFWLEGLKDLQNKELPHLKTIAAYGLILTRGE